MLYIIGAQLLIIGINLFAFLAMAPPAGPGGITGLVIDEGVIKPVSSNIKVVVAIVDAFILFSAVGLFLAIELYRPHFYN